MGGNGLANWGIFMFIGNGLNDKLKEIITDQQSLNEVVKQLQIICHELDLDFDLALDKSDAVSDVVCNHKTSFPSAGGSVFCPECNKYIVKGDGTDDIKPWTKENLWRPHG